MAPTRRIRILLADGHTVLRSGLRALLSAQADLEVVGEAAEGGEALRLAQTLKPAVVVMDIGMPGVNGIDATARIRRELPATRVLILSMHDDQGIERRARCPTTETGPSACGRSATRNAARRRKMPVISLVW